MNNQFLGFAFLLIVIPAFLLQSCSEGKVEVEISVYGPADCGTSTQTLDNQTELKIWAFEKKRRLFGRGICDDQFYRDR